jgi:hypothetical protein
MSEFEMALQKSSKPAAPAAVQTAIGRYTQEVQGMVFMAKQYPRDQYAAWDRIKTSCQRKSLAEVAQYAYPKGGKKITGPSIRLAEVLAQNWGNMSFGVVELEQKAGESTAMSFAWDLETNTRSEKIFTVKHEMKANNVLKKLTDPRDIYELVANMGARRQRACILAVIPKDITENACEECEKTLLSGDGEPLTDKIKKLLDKFKTVSVTKEMVEKRQGYRIDLFTAKDGIDLQKVFNAIKDGIGKRQDYFDIGKADPPPVTPSDADLEAELKADFERKLAEEAAADANKQK